MSESTSERASKLVKKRVSERVSKRVSELFLIFNSSLPRLLRKGRNAGHQKSDSSFNSHVTCLKIKAHTRTLT